MDITLLCYVVEKTKEGCNKLGQPFILENKKNIFFSPYVDRVFEKLAQYLLRNMNKDLYWMNRKIVQKENRKTFEMLDQQQ